MDDLYFLKENRTRVQLTHTFPFYGRPYTTVWADEDGILGFQPDYADGATPANFTGQRVIAPAWGSFMLRGSQPSTGAVHGVAVDQTQVNQTTFVWKVGPETGTDATYQFAATLFHTGEVLLRHISGAPPTTALKAVGASAGDGRTWVRNPSPPA